MIQPSCPRAGQRDCLRRATSWHVTRRPGAPSIDPCHVTPRPSGQRVGSLSARGPRPCRRAHEEEHGATCYATTLAPATPIVPVPSKAEQSRRVLRCPPPPPNHGQRRRST
jgi:hypothetical protein